jgi:NAD(P)-dependent dehydrogenase (short-subunit alcohol dehydrogenase family)
MDLRLRGKRALVTGSSYGIGRAVAEGLAAEGVSVAINSRNHEALEAAAKDITQSTGSTVVPIAADVSEADQVIRLVQEAATALGGLDILVNSVPAPVFGPFLEHPDEAWHKAMDIKFMSYIRTSREAIPHFRQAGGGVIVNNIGAGGKAYYTNHLAGGASNAALMLVTTGLATELGPLNIRVVGINAGFVLTPRIESLIANRVRTEQRDQEQVRQDMVAGIPTGRMATAQDVANLVVFLASDRARQINGTIVTIDGGMMRTL